MKTGIGIGGLLLVWLAGCASEIQHVRGPDGDVWISITCRRSQANCYERAGQECPYGYIAGPEDGHEGAFVTHNQYSTFVTPTYNGSLMVKCKDAPNAGSQASGN